MNIVEEVKKTIEEALPDAEVHVLDPMQDETHLEANVITDQFIGKSRVQQHRMVMEPLQAHFHEKLHALALKTYNKEQWSQRQT